MDIKTILLGIVISPALQALLQISGLLTLTPLAHWGWDPSIINIVTYLVTIGSAAFASSISARKNSQKRLWVVVSVLLLVVFFTAYMYTANTPPTDSYSWLYDGYSVVCFFGTYMAYGFVVARVIVFFATGKPARTQTP